ncbi:MAG: GDP-mannose 4,6-dehydratase [Candidatus Poseidoniaceae archaeon]|nr:GDP-mannose 4,6-dehydratase [Euryarchaeota archaeon]RAH07873.1 MAG: GDP-mannose 4,6-dehydratase [Euryarchaeota archaeon TMED132]|tara:strand:- start:5393 stop:6457 length:1065 start_codon:yes stop_codon:yes gene_type:complete
MGDKVAVITGVTGQDGSYLAELLLEKGYVVYGLVRRVSQPTLGRSLINHLIDNEKFHLINGDLADQNSIDNAVSTAQPDEFYNLGAMSFVPESWRSPMMTADITGLGALRCLEAIRKHAPNCKFYQAGSSEQYGKVRHVPQTEETPFHPRSPYGCAKVFAFEITRNYRESYDMFACTGILFNHESPRRGLEFVTRKVTMTAARIAHGFDQCLWIGNVEAKRDWGYAGDYVEMQWRMLQQEKPEDFVVATGRTHSVRDMISLAFSHVGMTLTWSGEGVDTIATDQNGEVRVRTNPKFFRPAEVDLLIGDASLSQKELGWVPETSFEQLVAMMVDSDMKIVQEAVDGGYAPPTPPE